MKKTTNSQSAPEDIINLILNDHMPLKECIEIMKDDEAELPEKRAAFEEFAPLLAAHAKPEEQTWYMTMKDDEELRVEGMEGDVEHALADQLCEELKRTDDEDLWEAKCKVLAELVEHHIEEEEDEMLPDYRKNSTVEDRIELGLKYLEFKAAFEEMGGDDAPHEGSTKAKKAEKSNYAKM